MTGIWTEEKKEAARQRAKERWAKKKQMIADPENSTETPVSRFLAKDDGFRISENWVDDPGVNKKLDAILDVLTKLVPMIKIEANPPKSSDQSESKDTDALLDLKQRLSNPKLKERALSTLQISKILGTTIGKSDTAIADNRAYWDALNLNLVEHFMKEQGFSLNREGKWVV